MKKVLIVAYYWPPSGGSGVQRWLKFIKYLGGFGWKPIVYTAENGEYPVVDESLVKEIPNETEVIRRPIWEPYHLYKQFIGQKKEEKIKPGFISDSRKPKLKERISRWIRGNFFIPDARKFWIKPSVKFLSEYLDKNHVDVLVTTGPPMSMHLIGLGVKRKTGIPWVADFRDPWTKIYYYKDLLLTPMADRKHRRLEKTVLQEADEVITNGSGNCEGFRDVWDREYHIITNGYDAKTTTPEPEENLDKKFSISYIGVLMPTQNHLNLWKALSELCEESESFRNSLVVKMIGNADVNALETIKSFGLEDQLENVGYVPYSKVAEYQRKTRLLLLLINEGEHAKGVLPGKVFEYISSGRPILCIGPVDGDSAGIIRETHTGITCDPSDLEGIKRFLMKSFLEYKSGKLYVQPQGVEKYSRKALTQTLADVLEKAVKASSARKKTQ